MIVKIGFYALSVVVFLMVIALLRYAENPKKQIRDYLLIGFFWLIYLLLISKAGVLNNFGLPPRVPLLLVFPTVIASIVFTGRKSFRNILEQVPLHLPVFFTSFRIFVEVLIYGAYLNGVFPQRVTFEGLNYDIFVGLSALPVGAFLVKKKLPLQALWLWNIISLMVLAITVYAFVSTYYFTDHLPSTSKTAFVQFPYLLLASVLLPIAVFLHVFSLRQIFMIRLNHARVI
ncbi:MAG: hypothetical protein ACK4S0_14725 [Sediminibacterium sp.]